MTCSRRQRARRPFDHDRALQHADDAARGRHRALQVLLDQEHRDAGRFQRLEPGVKAIDDQRRQAERHLVEQQEVRVDHQRAPDRRRLLLAARQCARERAAAILEIGKGLHHRVERPGARPAGGAREQEVFLDRQAGEQAPAFGHQREPERGARVSASCADVLALEGDARRPRSGARRRWRAAASSCRRRWRRRARPSRPCRLERLTPRTACSWPWRASSRSTESSVTPRLRRDRPRSRADRP